MSKLISVAQYSHEQGIPKDTMDTRIYNARKKSVQVKPVIQHTGNQPAMWRREDLNTISNMFATRTRSRSITRQVKPVARPDVVIEDPKSLAKAIIKINARSGLTGTQMDFLVDSLFEKF